MSILSQFPQNLLGKVWMVQCAYMPDIQPPEKYRLLPTTILRNIIMLSTSGFGLVVALAWNQVVQNLVQNYINPYLGKNSGLLSLTIYAVVMTTLAVLVTMQLTQIQQKLESLEARVAGRKKKTAAKRITTKKTKKR
jgi:hypothetical protein